MPHAQIDRCGHARARRDRRARRPDASLDLFSAHGSCPVVRGTKLIAQQWIRESWYEPRYDPGLAGYWPLCLPPRHNSDAVCPGDAVADAAPGAWHGASGLVDHSRHRVPLRLAVADDSRAPLAVAASGQRRRSGRWCTKPHPGLLRMTEVTGALSLSFWVSVGDDCKLPKAQRSEARLELSTARGESCCAFTVHIKGCSVRISGPSRSGSGVANGSGERGSARPLRQTSARTITAKLEPGDNHVFWGVENAAKEEEADPGRAEVQWEAAGAADVGGGRSWMEQRSWLLVNQLLQHPEQPPARAETAGVSWGNATLCYSYHEAAAEAPLIAQRIRVWGLMAFGSQLPQGKVDQASAATAMLVASAPRPRGARRGRGRGARGRGR